MTGWENSGNRDSSPAGGELSFCPVREEAKPPDLQATTQGSAGLRCTFLPRGSRRVGHPSAPPMGGPVLRPCVPGCWPTELSLVGAQPQDVLRLDCPQEVRGPPCQPEQSRGYQGAWAPPHPAPH